MIVDYKLLNTFMHIQGSVSILQKICDEMYEVMGFKREPGVWITHAIIEEHYSQELEDYMKRIIVKYL